MLSTVFVAVVSALATVGVVNALPTEPAKPPLTYLYSANLTIPPAYDIGTVPMGGRAILPLTGGSFSGPKLSGKVLIGLDWGLTSSGGVFSPDAVYVLQTTDGANIMVTEKGHAPFVQILFETASTKYAWLNSAVGISTGAPFDGGVALDVWQMGE